MGASSKGSSPRATGNNGSGSVLGRNVRVFESRLLILRLLQDACLHGDGLATERAHGPLAIQLTVKLEAALAEDMSAYGDDGLDPGRG